jgi:hypothetical protein
MRTNQRKIMNLVMIVACVLLLGAAASVQAQARDIIVTVENLAPSGGIYFTPVWVGLHDGKYDLFDPGGLSSEALERIAEDGDASALRMEFEAAAGGDAGGFDDVITAPAGFGGAPVFDPGDSASIQVNVDSKANRYMSFLSMIIPSNDAFIGNSNPKAIELFDAAGDFTGKKIITILGSMIWDAGTELNTEMDAAFINQADGNTGVTTVCPVSPHPGFLGSYANAGSDPIILGGTGPADIQFDATAADFTLPHAVIARITIEAAAPADQVIMMSGFRLMSLGRGNGPIIYVTSQDLYYDSIITADPLPFKGPFQQLFPPGTNPADPLLGLSTEFGPGDKGYVGGRWWVDVDGGGEMDPDDHYFSCPLLGPGRENP